MTARAAPIDNRTEATLQAAERELRLPDPTAAEPVTLQSLLPRDAAWWLAKFNQFFVAILDAAARRPDPIVVPTPASLRPILWACKGGHDGQPREHEPLWRALWDGEADRVHTYVRSLFQLTHNYKMGPETTEPIVHALALHIVAFYEAAVEQQKARLAKKARSPAARAQAAARLVELTEAMQSALATFGAAVADERLGPPEAIRTAAISLQRVEQVAREVLSR